MKPAPTVGGEFDDIFAARLQEADDFYATRIRRPHGDAGRARRMWHVRAYAGLL